MPSLILKPRKWWNHRAEAAVINIPHEVNGMSVIEVPGMNDPGASEGVFILLSDDAILAKAPTLKDYPPGDPAAASKAAADQERAKRVAFYARWSTTDMERIATTLEINLETELKKIEVDQLAQAKRDKTAVKGERGAWRYTKTTSYAEDLGEIFVRFEEQHPEDGRKRIADLAVALQNAGG